MKSAVADTEPIFSSNRGQIEKLIGRLRSLLEQNPKLYDWYGDQVANRERLAKGLSELALGQEH
ncbi:MAG TPA: hypothetical protein VF121_00820 [Thermoanaerobaculia bacterium]|nr:hypothetical protein [Thermoanaerobaculia bacterium]